MLWGWAVHLHRGLGRDVQPWCKVTPEKPVPHAREMVAAVEDTGSGFPWALSKLGAWSSRGGWFKGRLWLHPQRTGMLRGKYIRR